jgi:hypothetical protein
VDSVVAVAASAAGVRAAAGNFDAHP